LAQRPGPLVAMTFLAESIHFWWYRLGNLHEWFWAAPPRSSPNGAQSLSFGLRFWPHLPPNLTAKSDSNTKPKITPKAASRF
jgi:hypothetical protein